MSFITLSKVAALLTPAANKGTFGYDDARDSMCWVDESGAVWHFGERRKLLDADLSAFTSTTLADVTGIYFPLLANTKYKFEFSFLFLSAATGTGIKLAVTTPTSPTQFSANVWIPRAADGAGAMWNGTLKSGSDVVTSGDVEEASVVYEAFIRGTILNGANAGNIQLQAATEVAASGITPKAGTSGRLWIP
jgi:hypothetical protein